MKTVVDPEFVLEMLFGFVRYVIIFYFNIFYCKPQILNGYGYLEGRRLNT